MSEISITFIIPAYNAAPTLERAVSSVADMGRELSIEILIVDDGSTDNTSVIADQLAGQWDFVQAIHTNNAGVSKARNAGLSAAKGEWISFLDADDEIYGTSFLRLFECEGLEKYDIVFGIKEYVAPGDVNGTIYHELSLLGDPLEDVDISDALDSLLSVADDSLSGSCTRAIYRHSFLKGCAISFPVGVTMAEDFCFLLACFSQVRNMGSVGLLLYRVNRNSASVTQNAIPNIDDSMDYVNRCLSHISSRSLCCPMLLDIQRANNAWLRLDSHAKDGYRQVLDASISIYSSSDDRAAIASAWGPDHANRLRQAILRLGLIAPQLPAAILRLKRWACGFR